MAFLIRLILIFTFIGVQTLGATANEICAGSSNADNWWKCKTWVFKSIGGDLNKLVEEKNSFHKDFDIERNFF